MSSDYSKLYNNENVFVSSDGSGAGNNWAKGFHEVYLNCIK